MKPNLPDHIFVPYLHWNSYWGAYSRVLQQPSKSSPDLDWIEVNVTPVNGWRSFDAHKQVGRVRIRLHGTPRDKKDRDCNQLHVSHYQQLLKCAGPLNTRLILFGDLLPTIDWQLYHKLNNGGANYLDIKKPNVEVGFFTAMAWAEA